MLSRVWLFATPWTVAHQAPLSMEISRQEYWSRLPFPPSRDLPEPGIKPASPMSPALAGGFFYHQHHLVLLPPKLAKVKHLSLSVTHSVTSAQATHCQWPDLYWWSHWVGISHSPLVCQFCYGTPRCLYHMLEWSVNICEIELWTFFVLSYVFITNSLLILTTIHSNIGHLQNLPGF